MKRKTPESYLLEGVMDYLAAKHIFAMRMNSGAIRMDGQNGRTRVFRGHEAGTADVLALHGWSYNHPGMVQPQRVVWIECKAPNGKQSKLQKSFQERVEAEGHKYILAYSMEDVMGQI